MQQYHTIRSFVDSSRHSFAGRFSFAFIVFALQQSLVVGVTFGAHYTYKDGPTDGGHITIKISKSDFIA